MGLEVQASLEYYVMDKAPIQGPYGHQNFVLHDTTTGETVIGRGMPSEKYTQGKWRSVFNQPQKSKTETGNVKLKMYVDDSGKKGIDPATNNQTKTVPGSTLTLKDDMNTATQKLRQVVESINSKKADYLLQTINSNAAAGTAYNYVTGQTPPANPQLLPGSNLNVLTGRDSLAPHELTK